MNSLFPGFLPIGTIASDNRRFLIVFNHCALLALAYHFFFIPIFALQGIAFMAMFNVLSTILWSSAIWLNRQGHHSLGLMVGLTEAVAHASLAVYFVGWDCGFQYYLFIAAPLAFYSPVWTRLKVAMVVGAGLLYLVLDAYDRISGPLHVLSPLTVAWLNYGNVVVSFAVLSSVTFYYQRIASQTEAEMERVNQELKVLADTDPLTSLLNRRKMIDEIEREITRFQRSKRPFSLLLADLDDFKKINDQFGHEAGDDILRAVARIMGDQVRKGDRLARWGGEEFLVLLPETDREGAMRAAEKIRDAVVQHPFAYHGRPIAVTVTFGLTVFQEGDLLDQCIVRADQALYLGKTGGKNQVIVSV